MDSVVLFSGGWDSTCCLVKAIKRKEKVLAFYANYGQCFLSDEIEAAKAITNKLGVELIVKSINKLESKDGVFFNRNELILRAGISETGSKLFWFGCRNPLAIFDRYKDSNYTWKISMEKTYGVRIETPCVMMPKFMIKRYVKSHSLDNLIYSTEESRCGS